MTALFTETPLPPCLSRVPDERRRIPIHQLRHSISTPRCHIDDDALEQLRYWIEQHGVLQPLLVRPLSGHEFEVIAGERRLRAAQRAGLTDLECLVRHYHDDGGPIPFDASAREEALISNLLNERLNEVETSRAILELVCLHVGEQESLVISRLGAMHYQASKLKGRNNVVTPPPATCLEDDRILNAFKRLKIRWQSFYTHKVPLLELPEAVQALLHEKLVKDYTQLKRIARVEEPERTALLERIRAQRLRGSRLTRVLDELLGKTQVSDPVVLRFESIKRHLPAHRHDPEVLRLISELETRLGLKVA
jgi:ParB family transcriptional regulator, chromosome partitioning protein